MKKAVLLVNLGSPDSCSVKDVKPYLDEFLMDKYVIDVPYLLRWVIVKCFILPFRPKRSAEAYQTIWWKEGSPLIVLSYRLLEALKKVLDMPVALGMRYGNPSILSGIQELVDSNPDLEEVLLFPLYPHYAMASTKTVIEKTKQVVKTHFSHLRLSYIESFYTYEPYIKSLSQTLQDALSKTEIDHVLFSFHGVPERHVIKTDPTSSHCLQSKDCCERACSANALCYSHHVKQTAYAVAKDCQFENSFYSISFQSRLGKDPWLQPFTDKTIGELAKKGVKNLAVICPAFVSDCLETLEEMGEEGKEIFLENGGKSFTLIPCLNDNPLWVECMRQIISDEAMHKKG
ncbi:ferrochelatase [Candidatus Marinamargulisbacteria bacterium SCGC AG-343-D04]|nr:ferrochelatase [Candidatus Marinamargulisbacteria bacterium SCGC AG-343-D04]